MLIIEQKPRFEEHFSRLKRSRIGGHFVLSVPLRMMAEILPPISGPVPMMAERRITRDFSIIFIRFLPYKGFKKPNFETCEYDSSWKAYMVGLPVALLENGWELGLLRPRVGLGIYMLRRQPAMTLAEIRERYTFKVRKLQEHRLTYLSIHAKGTKNKP